jgi:hypothetical protein
VAQLFTPLLFITWFALGAAVWSGAITPAIVHEDAIPRERTPILVFRHPLTRFALASSLCLPALAGCATALPTATGGLPHVRFNLPGHLGSVDFPGESPDVGSTNPGSPAAPAPYKVDPPSVPDGATGIKVYVNDVIAPASSYLLATNRNHTSDNFPNGQAKLEKLKELRPTWGAARYMYRIGHGPTDGRSDYGYMTGYHFEQCWDKNGGYPYDDLRNALKEANQLDAEQLHVVNFGTSDAQEAARYVSYLNNPSDSNRAAHPYPVQNAKYFELGNEISWSVVRGHDQYAANDQQYAQRAKEFAQAMRAASPTPIKIGAVATTNSNWLGDGWSGGANTVKTILQTMGNDVDFLIYHGYPSWPMKQDGNLMSLMAQNAWNDQKLTSEIDPAIRQYETHPVFIANTEFFTELYSDPSTARAMFGALYSADTVTLAFNHAMIIANQFCFDHGDQSDASFFVNDDPNRTTPIFAFQKMLAKNWGDTILRTEGQAIPTVHVSGNSAQIDMPKLAYTAARGANGHVYVMVTNRTSDSDVSSQVALGFRPSSVAAHVLKGSNGWTSGPGDAQETTRNVSLDGPLTFPAASVTILEATP